MAPAGRRPQGDARADARHAPGSTRRGVQSLRLARPRGSIARSAIAAPGAHAVLTATSPWASELAWERSSANARFGCKRRALRRRRMRNYVALDQLTRSRTGVDIANFDEECLRVGSDGIRRFLGMLHPALPRGVQHITRLIG